MSSWVRYSVAVYMGLLMAGTFGDPGPPGAGGQHLDMDRYLEAPLATWPMPPSRERKQSVDRRFAEADAW
jgi:hypothetical protein